ncbi:MAG: thiol peroxidase [candidate division KSB1 bacterium]|nr:thiol peroxidase [candidate division KSB1 bacterium]MDZ7275089.1 thiol peroxidase [candidate division KSB1 bacterium]MDZ7286463.1 thiol peroxidase [candidate division KSB1 bacterium]MDZ7299373.1 thiol peroxidase [candidate division KSB1 bacterium]MDZ7306298.1 thiol peroxidase [candidate division KSB1 bacterium]
MALERKGAVTLGGKPLTLVGAEIKVGDRAPAFTVMDNKWQTVRFENLGGKPTLLSSILSVNTGVCDAEIRRFNQEAGKLGDKAQFLTISTDLPCAQAIWCGHAGVQNVQTYADHLHTSFGLAYGTLVKEIRVLSRAIFVIDRDGIVQYVEYVPEIGQHPDYDRAMAAIHRLL